MAKALLGYMSSDLRNPARLAAEKLAAENRRLRERVLDLETLIARLQDENDRLTAAQAAAILEPIEEMQPA
jgi:cell division protein FtsB